VSSKGWGGGVRKKGEDKQTDFPLAQFLPRVCGKLARTGFGVFPDRVNFPQSSSNVGAWSVRWKNGAAREMEPTLMFAVKRWRRFFIGLITRGEIKNNTLVAAFNRRADKGRIR
jgi:hypothetical protein